MGARNFDLKSVYSPTEEANNVEHTSIPSEIKIQTNLIIH